MGVKESKALRAIKIRKRLDWIVYRQCEIEQRLEECTDELVALLQEYDNLSVERGNVERELREVFRIRL